MQEVFYEESSLLNKEKAALGKYRLLKTFSIISYVLAGLVVLMFFYFYNLENFSVLVFAISVLLPIALFLFFGIMLGRMKNSMYVDYDYTYVSGSIRISKIIRKIKRKNILKFEAGDIVQMGKYGSNQTPSDGCDFFYLQVNTEGSNKLLIFDCSEKFMATILRYSNKTILEKDYK